MRRLTLALLAPALLLALALPSFAFDDEDELTRIHIKVVDEKGKPVDRASVRVVFKQGRHKIKLTKIQHSWEMKTSQDGEVSIPPLPKGDILVQVMAKFYQTYGETLTIEENERTLEVVLKDPQSQYSSHTGKADTKADAEEKK